MIGRLAKVARHELRLLASEPVAVSVYVVMPLLIVAFVRGAHAIALRYVEGRTGVNGAELAVPGQATMFGFMVLAAFGYFFLGEHGWNTWNRLRSLGVRPSEILAGKLAVNYLHQLIQFLLLVAGSMVLFDLRVRGSWGALFVLEAAAAAMIVGFGALAAAVARTQAQFNVFAYLGALVLAGFGGALVPATVLPEWARTVGPATPTYWAMRGFRAVLVDGRGLGAITLPALVLLAFALGFAAVAAWILDPDQRKSTYA